MTPDKQEIVGGVSAVIGAELVVVLGIFILATIAVNVDAIGFAIMSMVDFQ